MHAKRFRTLLFPTEKDAPHARPSIRYRNSYGMDSRLDRYFATHPRSSIRSIGEEFAFVEFLITSTQLRQRYPIFILSNFPLFSRPFFPSLTLSLFLSFPIGDSGKQNKRVEREETWTSRSFSGRLKTVLLNNYHSLACRLR